MACDTGIRETLPHPEQRQTPIGAQAKAAAVQRLSALLRAIHAGQIALGDWEKISIENALALMRGGLYMPALHEIACATFPRAERSPNLSPSERTAARTVEDFDRALERLMQPSESRSDYDGS